MLAIEMEDLIAVLQLCVPYFAVIIAAILIGVIVMIACRRLSRSKKFLVRGETALAMILLIAVAVNGICFGPMSTLIGLAMGKDTVTKETNKEAGDVAESIMGEGIVLLENEGLLPLTDHTVHKLHVNLGLSASSNSVNQIGFPYASGIVPPYPLHGLLLLRIEVQLLSLDRSIPWLSRERALRQPAHLQERIAEVLCLLHRDNPGLLKRCQSGWGELERLHRLAVGKASLLLKRRKKTAAGLKALGLGFAERCLQLLLVQQAADCPLHGLADGLLYGEHRL